MKVLINGVQVDMWDDTIPSRFKPMRATIQFVADFAKTHPDDQDPVAVERLRAAGVKFIPPARTELDADGIEYEAAVGASA